jgi:hypothetical protein
MMGFSTLLALLGVLTVESFFQQPIKHQTSTTLLNAGFGKISTNWDEKETGQF